MKNHLGCSHPQSVCEYYGFYVLRVDGIEVNTGKQIVLKRGYASVTRASCEYQTVGHCDCGDVIESLRCECVLLSC